MPSDNVTVSLQWWKLDTPAAMLEALTDLHTSFNFRGSVSVGPMSVGEDGSQVQGWQLQFSAPAQTTGNVANTGAYVTCLGGFAEVLTAEVFAERYPALNS